MTVQNDAPNILFLDNHLIAVYKPAGILIQADNSKSKSLMDEVKSWIKNEFKKPGNVFLGLLHRLDRNVPGVVLFARTSKAASRLSKQFRDKTIKKIYHAIVEGKPEAEQDFLSHHLRKEKSLKTTVFKHPGKKTQNAELEYTIIESYSSSSFLEVALYTGRFHQIRAQLAFIGHPIIGDKKYGASTLLSDRQIALYAHRLIFEHPITKKEICIESPIPAYWPKY